jgi:hypothetical protein
MWGSEEDVVDGILFPCLLAAAQKQCQEFCVTIDGACAAIEAHACGRVASAFDPRVVMNDCNLARDSTDCRGAAESCVLAWKKNNPSLQCFVDACDEICKESWYSWCGLAASHVVAIVIGGVVFVGSTIAAIAISVGARNEGPDSPFRFP